MSSGNKRKGIKQFLDAPLRFKRLRSAIPGPISTSGSAFNSTPTNTPGTTIPSTNIGIVSSSALAAGPANATGPQPLIQASNFQTPAIPIPVKNEAFQKAIQEHVDNLSDDDKVAFQSATDVIQKLGELQRGKSRIFRSQTSETTYIQKVQRVLQCVKQFIGSIAICIQHSPQISALVVGGLNCILSVGTPRLTFNMSYNLFLLGSFR